jgi:hypothetical protein
VASGSSLLFYGGSIGCGLLLGWLSARLWRLCAPREANRRFWLSLGDITRQMLEVDEVAWLLALYRRLARSVGSYVLRNLGGLLLACLPVAAFLILVAPSVLALWDRGAERVVLYPSGSTWQIARSVDLSDPSVTGPGAPDIGPDIAGTAGVGRIAACSSLARCTIFRALGFRVLEGPEPLLNDAPYLVIRAHRGHRNFLWPYLNDLEFAFGCAFIVGTIGSLFWHRTAA